MSASMEARSQIEVLKTGALTTVQDLGRIGYLGAGVPGGGAMDRLAARVANRLVGNPEGAAVLETTMAGPVLLFNAETLVAVCGASFTGVPEWRPFIVKPGELLSLTDLARGCRGYVAVAGGFVVPLVMRSASTYLRAGLGGLEGRALHKSDQLSVGLAANPHLAHVKHWHLSSSILPAYSHQPVVRVTRGAQWDWFSEEGQYRLCEARFSVLPNSDRMGLRLKGAALTMRSAREMASEAVTFGSIQVPPDGQPIVLMADRQTIGGYPKIAEVISVDLPLLAQLRPGEQALFTHVSLEEAQALYLAEEHALSRLHEGLAEKLL